MSFILNPELWTLTVAISVPLIYAALGGMFSERGGVINIAMEGMMLTGAFVAVVFAYATHNAWLGLAAGVASGAGMALLFSWAALTLTADQVVVGMSINLLALGLTGYLLDAFYGYNGTPISTPSLPTVHLPVLAGIPVLGPALAQENILTYLLLPTVLFAQFALFRTRWGLRLRAMGEKPEAGRSAGLGVRRYRLSGILLSGMLSGVAGAYLSIGVLNSFNVDMTAGRGYIALAAMIFGNWRPRGVVMAALIFGFLSAASIQLQGSVIPPDVVLMVPYLLTVVAVAGIVGRTTPPASDGVPYHEESI
ncbi:MAG: ABC transporter permease [Thermaerobacter sp.]|nr:ABC transporter permease [Thermaerobacter sp.]